MRLLALACATTCVALAACAPTARELMTGHHDREAVCAIDTHAIGAASPVGAALDRDANARIQIDAVAPDTLARAAASATTVYLRRSPPADEVASRLAGRARLVRVTVATDRIPVDRVGAWVAFERAPGTLDGDAGELATLVAWTGEPMPAARTVDNYVSWGNAFRLLGGVLTAGVTLVPGPHDSTNPLWFQPHGTVTVPPSDPDYAETAPVAYALHETLAPWPRPSCETLGEGQAPAGVRCTFWRLAPATGPLDLDLTLTMHVDHAPDGPAVDLCSIRRTTTLHLGDAADLDGTLARTFAARPRRVADLAQLGSGAR